MKVYFDNAATTPLDPEVMEAMLPFMTEHFGNPSSTHAFGRTTKNAIETARRQVASMLHCEPSEITFTSGGTEADNMAIHDAVVTHGVQHIVTSRIEHHAVLDTAIEWQQSGIQVHYIDLDDKGNIQMGHLEKLLARYNHVLVSLMHANNEIANLLDLKVVSDLCVKHQALFHSDTVQSMAHYSFDLSALPIDYITGSAHKFHGPKGVGFLYHRKKKKFSKIVHGGSQERGHRSGTENLYGIVGLAKAFTMAYENIEAHRSHIFSLKKHMITRLRTEFPDVVFNGMSADTSLYTVLSVQLPETKMGSMLLFGLDLEGIAVSGGSACTSGSDAGSHVLEQLKQAHDGPSVRFSFSKMNTIAEVDYCILKLKEIYTR